MTLINFAIKLFDPLAMAAVALVFLPLERLLPLHDPRPRRTGWTTDLVYFLVNGAVIRTAMFLVIVALGKGASVLVPQDLRQSVAGLPLWLQAITLILAADFGFYWAHRLFHAAPALWRFHAIHHSSEHLDWMAAFRVHPLDQVFSATASVIPMLAFGFSDWAVAVHVVSYRWQSVLLHSNVRLPLGRLAWLIATPEFHHWHHSQAPAARDRNFGGQTGLWDLIFGTWRMPRGESASSLGVDDPIPPGYLRQLMWPFRRQIPQGPGEARTSP